MKLVFESLMLILIQNTTKHMKCTFVSLLDPGWLGIVESLSDWLHR